MRECFIPKVFNARHFQIIQTADRIMSEYASQGYDLSLRQLYYQFVAHHGLPNSEQNYKMLGNVISDARLAGNLDWDMLVDRGRGVQRNSHWDSPADIIDSAAYSFRIDKWASQPNYVICMVEKQALEGVLAPVCRRLDIPFSSNKGYSSSSAMYRIAQDLKSKLEDGKNVTVIYLGDHDPSGIDMTRDVEDRLKLMSGYTCIDEDDGLTYETADYAGSFEVERVALNMPQIRRFNPPPNPAKMTDSRAGSYVSQFGYESWELDALNPETLASLVTGTVEDLRDEELWQAAVSREEDMRKQLRADAQKYRGEQ